MADEHKMKLKVDTGLPGDKLEELRKSSTLCDIKITAATEETFSAHKLVLIARSEFFCKMILSPSFAESTTQTVKLEEPAEIVTELLRYIYTGEITVTEHNAQTLLKAADQYCLLNLFKTLEDHVADNVDKDNCIALLGVAKLLNANKLYKKTLEFIEGNFDLISNFQGLDKEVIIYFAKSSKVTGKKFLTMFCRWFSENQDENTASQVLECLSFKQLDRNTVRQVQDIFGHLPACMKIICRKLVDELIPSPSSEDPPSGKTLCIQITRLCFKNLLDHKELKDGLVQCADGSNFRASLLDKPFRIRFLQTGGTLRKVLLRSIYKVQGSDDTFATYTVHDFNTGLCDLKLCHNNITNLWLAVYDVSSPLTGKFFQRSCQHLDTVKDISKTNKNVKVRKKELEYDVCYDVKEERITMKVIKGLKNCCSVVVGLGQNWVLHECDFSSSPTTSFRCFIEEKKSVCLDLFRTENIDSIRTL